MPNTREKLIDLLWECQQECQHISCTECDYFGKKLCSMQWQADHLIANGVTVQKWILPEEDYYVLRNTETGMYFRGKGVNRWGKHFNQATIYRIKGTAEHSIKEVAWHGEKAELVRIKIVEMPQPPKGE